VQFLETDLKFIQYREDHPKLVLDNRLILLRLDTIRFANIKQDSFRAVRSKTLIFKKQILDSLPFVFVRSDYEAVWHLRIFQRGSSFVR
jgi:hypothetical protein